MKSSRLAIFGLIAGASFAACADEDDTVLSLNIQADGDVANVSALHVTVTQGSRAPVERDFTMLPTRTTGEAGATQTVLAGGFFERIVLPDSWADGPASVDVECFDEAGVPTLDPPPVTAYIKENETVAVFVTLKAPESTGGAGGAPSGAGGAGGAATAAGGTANGTGGAGGAPGDAGGAGGAPSDGSAGASNAGGEPGEAGSAGTSDAGGAAPAAGAASTDVAGSSAGGSSDAGD